MINYKLAKEIGATHYAGGEPLSYYKLTDFDLLYFNDCIGEYQLSNNSSSWVARNLKPIPPNHTRTEYEKVTESIFDLRDEFERGELYMKLGDELLPVPNETQLSILLDHGRCYRKVEKVVDCRKETKSYLKSDNGAFKLYQLEAMLGAISEYPEQYLEHCRVALRANGEIE